MGRVDRQEVRGDVAQLVERPLCTRKASGSNPLISTSFKGFSSNKNYISILCTGPGM